MLLKKFLSLAHTCNTHLSSKKLGLYESYNKSDFFFLPEFIRMNGSFDLIAFWDVIHNIPNMHLKNTVQAGEGWGRGSGSVLNWSCRVHPKQWKTKGRGPVPPGWSLGSSWLPDPVWPEKVAGKMALWTEIGWWGGVRFRKHREIREPFGRWAEGSWFHLPSAQSCPSTGSNWEIVPRSSS